MTSHWHRVAGSGAKCRAGAAEASVRFGPDSTGSHLALEWPPFARPAATVRPSGGWTQEVR